MKTINPMSYIILISSISLLFVTNSVTACEITSSTVVKPSLTTSANTGLMFDGKTLIKKVKL